MMSNATYKTNLTINLSGNFQEFEPEYPLKIAVYCLVIVLSLVGNSLVIAVVCKNANKRMRTPSNYFVVSMAVGDGLITAVNMVPSVLFLAYQSSMPFSGLAGLIVCKMQYFMWMFLISWSTGSLSAIAVDRFLLVFFPLKRIVTLRIARMVVAAIITIAAATSCPLLIFSAPIEHEGKTFCYVNTSHIEVFLAFLLFFFAAFVFFPLVTSLVLYTAISLKLWLRKAPGNQENRTRMNRRIVIMLMSVVVLFVLCWMPVSSLTFGCLAYPDKNICSILDDDDIALTIWFLAYSNSAINPYVYFVFNENFRHGARVIWTSICGCCPGSFNRRNQIGVDLEMNQNQASNKEQEDTQR